MANTLTGLIPTLYQAADTVSRELTGMIPAVFINATAEQAAVNQTITYPVAPVSSAADIIPASLPPDTGDQVIAPQSMTITKARAVPVRWTGEEIRGIGVLYQQLLQNQFTQAMRALVNEVETDLCGLYTGASRAYGTAGSTPFATAGDFSDAAQVRKILADNGAPLTDLHLVISTSAGANIRGKQAQVYMQGDSSLLRQGVILDMHGLQIRESAQVANVTKGTGASYVTSGSTAIKTTAVTLATGTGTVNAGDVVTFAVDTANKYVVGAGVAAPGIITLNNPGVLTTIPTANAMTIGANYSANLCFDRNAIHLIARTPTMPVGGDDADDVTTITDPRSGLTFQVALYREYRRIRYEVGLAWGVKVVKPSHVAILMG